MGGFSQFAYLGYLNQYSKQELMERLMNYQISTVFEDDAFQIIRFIGEDIRIDIKYTIIGIFVGIIEEEWFDVPFTLVRE
ncbi:hypothetical protein PQG44_09380 [Aquirufa sp. LEPPI-3A]|uniref:hypothetical protein n=1 Tax=Aquirufa regiilacus TaxID=3024868 RepID=UPI0028DE8603|nr:hypothetical protein [Aquirufa sp. LEPPI-3A]MDT8887888.1 hypothetical protein [Aquirufa sp. LEPPI-3A]